MLVTWILLKPFQLSNSMLISITNTKLLPRLQTSTNGLVEILSSKMAQLPCVVFGRWPQAGLKANDKIDLGLVTVPAGKEQANVLILGWIWYLLHCQES